MRGFFRAAIFAWVVTGLVGAASPASAASFTLTNGSLSATINDAGIIDTLTFLGVDFYNPGTPVADWGVQVGGNTATFRINDQFGTVGIAGSSDGVSTFTGTYNPGFGINATITRTFSLVPGQNILRIDTVLTSVTAATFRFFDTYDPDQGIDLGDGFVTSNDRFTLGPFEVLRAVADVGSGASAPYTVIMGSTKPEGFLSGDLGISDGTELNNFFNSGGGIDPNNAVADIGMTLAWSIAASAGVPIRFSSFQSYGATPAAAAALPEPGTLLLLGGGLAGVARRLRRRQRS